MDQEVVKIIRDANQSIKMGREKLEESIKQLTELLENHPKSGSLCSAICHLYLVLEKTDIPEAWLSIAIKYDAELKNEIIAATTRYYQEGRLNEGLELLERFVRVDPENHEAWNDLGAVLYALNNWTRAKDAFEKALQLNPAYGESILNLIVLYMVLDQNQLALKTAERALEGDCTASPHVLKEIAKLIESIHAETAERILDRAGGSEDEMGAGA